MVFNSSLPQARGSDVSHNHGNATSLLGLKAWLHKLSCLTSVARACASEPFFNFSTTFLTSSRTTISSTFRDNVHHCPHPSVRTVSQPLLDTPLIPSLSLLSPKRPRTCHKPPSQTLSYRLLLRRTLDDCASLVFLPRFDRWCTNISSDHQSIHYSRRISSRSVGSSRQVVSQTFRGYTRHRLGTAATSSKLAKRSRTS